MSQVITTAKKVLTRMNNNLRRFEKSKGVQQDKRDDLKAIQDLINHASKLELQELEDENGLADYLLYIGELKSRIKELEERYRILELHSHSDYDSLIKRMASDLRGEK
jgi:hypothetical protein